MCSIRLGECEKKNEKTWEKDGEKEVEKERGNEAKCESENGIRKRA